MTEKQNAGAADAGTPSSSKNDGLDTFEDSVKEAVRKQGREDLDSAIADILQGLGDPERDTEQVRRYREWVFRLQSEPLQAVGIAPPQTLFGEVRVMVLFAAEPCWLPFFIAAPFMHATLLAARLRRINDCEFVVAPPWGQEAST